MWRFSTGISKLHSNSCKTVSKFNFPIVVEVFVYAGMTMEDCQCITLLWTMSTACNCTPGCKAVQLGALILNCGPVHSVPATCCFAAPTLHLNGIPSLTVIIDSILVYPAGTFNSAAVQQLLQFYELLFSIPCLVQDLLGKKPQCCD